MKAHLRTLFKTFFEARAFVLMYHRIAESNADIWDIAVSPAHFESQLQWLQKRRTVIPLPELVKGLLSNNLKRNSIAITFDDGYLDNFLTAKPLLEKYGLPATFFIATGTIGKHTEFWWDELEALILHTPALPPIIKISIGGEFIIADLAEETQLNEALIQRHQSWQAGIAPPPTKRSQLFYTLWQKLKPLPYLEQKEALQQIRNWIGVQEIVRQDFASMTKIQVKELSQHQLFTIGAHTVSHPALAFHPDEFQKFEISQNIKQLEEITGDKINMLAYPYGNYNTETITVVKESELIASFTTEAKPVANDTPAFNIGRFQVADWDQPTFAARMRHWMK